MELLEVLETLGDHPQREVRIGARAQRAIGSQDRQPIGERVEQFGKLGAHRGVVLGGYLVAPARTRLVEEVADVLANRRRGCLRRRSGLAGHKGSHGGMALLV